MVKPAQRQNEESHTSHVKSFLKETTAHGFKYLAEETTLAERLTWVVVLLVSFSYSGYFIYSGIKESNENQIVSSVEVVDSGKVDFPAVTVFGGLNEIYPSYRFVSNVMNTLEYDCMEDLSEGCFDKTYKQREDFRPLFENFVRTVRDLWKVEQVRGNHYYSPTAMESAIKATRFKELLPSFCIMWKNQPMGLTQEHEQLLISKLASVTESHKVGPTMVAALEEIISQEGYNNDGKNCSVALLMDSKYGPIIDTIYMIRNYPVEYKAGFGYLFEYSFYSVTRFLLRNDLSLLPNDIKSDDKSSGYPDEILSSLVGEDANLTTDELAIFLKLYGYKTAQSNFLQHHEPKQNCTQNPAATTPVVNQCLQRHVDKDLQAVLKVAKYFYQPATSNILPGSSYYRDMETGLNLKNYSLRCNLIGGTCLQSDPIIRFCNYGFSEFSKPRKAKTGDCSMFHQTLGFEGIQYSANAASFKDLFKETSYTNVFHDEIYNQFLEEDEDKDVKVERMDFYIHPPFMDYYNSKQSWTPSISFHHPYQLANKPITLEPGYIYTITVTPSLIKTDQDLISLPEETRGCRFIHEMNSSSIFKNYTESTCVFECKLKMAFEKVGCIPWDFPHFESPFSICNFWKARQFREIFDSSSTRSCSCLADCDIYDYAVTVSRKEFTVSHTTFGCDEKLQFISGKRGGQPVFDQMNSWEDRNCMSHITRVLIRMDTSSVTVTRRMARVTITDMIANLGGVVGLFTGMSMLTLIEVFVWICRTAIKTMAGLCSPNKTQDLRNGT